MQSSMRFWQAPALKKMNPAAISDYGRFLQGSFLFLQTIENLVCPEAFETAQSFVQAVEFVG